MDEEFGKVLLDRLSFAAAFDELTAWEDGERRVYREAWPNHAGYIIGERGMLLPNGPCPFPGGANASAKQLMDATRAGVLAAVVVMENCCLTPEDFVAQDWVVAEAVAS